MDGTAKHVSSCLQLAILLEVSAGKPGNISRKADFQGTNYEHFLASAVAAEPSFVLAAERGILAFNGEIPLEGIGIGEIIKKAVANVMAWQHGGNTLLGTLLLLCPISAAAGMTLSEKKELAIPKLRDSVGLVVRSTTPFDAVAVYDAITAADPSGLVGKAPTLDLYDPESRTRILEENITLYDVLKISASYDSVSRELTENFPLTFDTGLPYFFRQLEETGSLETAIVHTFLKVLSTAPDTLIARKTSLRKAEDVSLKAEEVLALGGLATQLGRKELSSLDKELRQPINRLNPGTTADIIAAVLAVSILSGVRP